MFIDFVKKENGLEKKEGVLILNAYLVDITADVAEIENAALFVYTLKKDIDVYIWLTKDNKRIAKCHYNGKTGETTYSPIVPLSDILDIETWDYLYLLEALKSDKRP